MRAGRRLGDDVEVIPYGGEDVGFKERMKKAFEEGREKGKRAGSFSYQVESRLQEKEEERERLKQLKKDKIPYCPKCHSTNLTFVKKGVSLGRTAVGGMVGSLFSPVGSAAGAVLGGLTGGKGKVKCLNCGKEWKL